MGQDQERLHQRFRLDQRLDLDQMLGQPGGGVEGGDVHHERGQRPLIRLGLAPLGGLHGGAGREVDPGVAEEPEGHPVERLQKPLIEGQALPVKGDETQARMVALAPGVDHEPVAESRFLPARPTERGPQLLLAERERMVGYHLPLPCFFEGGPAEPPQQACHGPTQGGSATPAGRFPSEIVTASELR